MTWKRWKKRGMALILTMAFTVTNSCIALAAGEITSISLVVSADLEVGEEVDEMDAEVTSSNTRFEITGWEFQNGVFQWSDQDIPVLKVWMKAKDKRKFALHSKEGIRLKGAGAKYLSATREEDSTVFTVIMMLTPFSHVLDPIDGVWLTEEGMASWGMAKNAGSYEVSWGRNGDFPMYKLWNTSYYDGREKMTRPGCYQLKVRAVNKDDKEVKGEWYYSPEMEVSNELAARYRTELKDQINIPAPQEPMGWLQDGVGWWYRNSDGSCTKSDWQLIDDNYYYFDEEGYMETGWVWWAGGWYYCAESGEMLSDTVTPDGFRLDQSGRYE